MDEEIITDGASEVFARVALAMEDAVKEYGADAVDLALMAYRVQSAQVILWGVLCIAIIVGIGFLYRWIWRAAAGLEGDADADIAARGFFGVVSVLASSGLFIGAISNLTQLAHWLSLFGKPELLIATKALEAAGLM